jgi:ornithine cyclodeaminase/alanine dehydrogenase-like protein (mu-crystallin family)
MSILYLCGDEVRALCAKIDPVAAVRDALILHAQGHTVLPAEAYLQWDTGGWGPARSINMPGFLGSPLNAPGTKIINANPSNPNRSLPRASGVIALFDPSTAQVTCLMEAATISALRTACVTAICAELFCGNDINQLALLGAGALAAAHLELLLPRLAQLNTVRIYDPVAQRAVALRARFHTQASQRGVRVQTADSAEDAVRGTQLVVPVTTVTEGYLRLGWLAERCLLVNVSLDDPMPEVVLQADLLVVDDWGLVRADSRRLLGRLYRAGLITGPGEDRTRHPSARPVDAELGQLLVGAPGLIHGQHGRIVVNPFGMSLEDLAVATHVYRVAQDLGIGIQLRL